MKKEIILNKDVRVVEILVKNHYINETYKRYAYYFNGLCLGCSYKLLTLEKINSIKEDMKKGFYQLKNFSDLNMLKYL